VDSVEDLDVFQLSHELAVKIYGLTLQFPREEQWGLGLQMRRAAASIGANLAEGAKRLNKREFRQFVGIARGSAAEIAYLLLLAKDVGFVQGDSYEDPSRGYDRVGQMLTRLAQSLAGE
jgi:four helix bundle protein